MASPAANSLLLAYWPHFPSKRRKPVQPASSDWTAMKWPVRRSLASSISSTISVTRGCELPVCLESSSTHLRGSSKVKVVLERHASLFCRTSEHSHDVMHWRPTKSMRSRKNMSFTSDTSHDGMMPFALCLTSAVTAIMGFGGTFRIFFFGLPAFFFFLIIPSTSTLALFFCLRAVPATLASPTASSPSASLIKCMIAAVS
mmetsp:Transcript_12/g.32  ORF Transcript_12/g.32 Transcript_12/m.32 type:complete len:201 (-) Transcript_12:614-1216(-)